MILEVPLAAGMNAPVLLNRCGYATLRDPRAGETSFVRRLGSYFYPRFHLYIQEQHERVARISLHLDMKQHTHVRGRAHSGEYEGQQVEAEAQRIEALARSLAGQA